MMIAMESSGRTIDAMKAREDFPILQRILPSGRNLVYLDNAATTQKPKQVIDAMSKYYEEYNSNVHRAVHTLAGEATDAYESGRQKVADWFGTSREQVIFTSGTTEAINLVAFAWARSNLKKGDAIVITEMEHHADIVPWQILQQDLGIEIRFVPVNTEKFELDMDVLKASLDGAKLVGVVHTSNVLGTRNPIEEIIKMSKESGAKVLIDAAQAAPHDRIGFDDCGADFVSISAHKMCGPTGIGCLLATKEVMSEMKPFMSGGDMIKEVFLEYATYQEGPYKFEAGTPKIAEAVGWGAAIDWLSQWDMHSVHEHCNQLASWTASEISEIPGITIYGNHDNPECSGVVSFLHETMHAEDLAHFLDAGGFAVRTGHHCAQPLMRKLGIAATNRASYYLYNTMEEAEAFVAHLRKVVERFA